MLQVFQDHLLTDLAYCRTKVTSRPKMPSPVALLQGRKLLKQLAECPPFDAAHDLAWRHLGGHRDEDVDMIFADNPLENPYLERFAGLTH